MSEVLTNYSRKFRQIFLRNYKYAFGGRSEADVPHDRSEYIKILIENKWEPAIL